MSLGSREQRPTLSSWTWQPSHGHTKFYVSHGLQTDFRDPNPREQDVQPKELFAYILVVQGVNASERSKVVTKTTLDGVARSMLREAANGFSIVFSGVVFRSNIANIFPENESPSDLRFVKGKDVAELNELAPVETYHNGEMVGILC